MVTSIKKSLDKSCQRLNTEAPNTFRIPISFVRCAAMKVAKPNNPKPIIKMANKAKTLDKLLICSSAANFVAYSSSANLYSKGIAGRYYLKTSSTIAKALAVLSSGCNFTSIQLVFIPFPIIYIVCWTFLKGDSISISSITPTI